MKSLWQENQSIEGFGPGRDRESAKPPTQTGRSASNWPPKGKAGSDRNQHSTKHQKRESDIKRRVDAVQREAVSGLRMMTPEQEKHLERIKVEFVRLVDPKYRNGQAEHGGNLLDHSAEKLLDSAINEAVDQIVYLLTLRDSIRASAVGKCFVQEGVPR